MDFSRSRDSFHVRVNTLVKGCWYVKEFLRDATIEDLANWLQEDIRTKEVKNYFRIWTMEGIHDPRETGTLIYETTKLVFPESKLLREVVTFDSHGNTTLFLDLSYPDSWDMQLVFVR